MRRLTPVFVAVFLSAGMARAAGLPAAVCQPYSSQWAAVSGGSDVRGMARVIGSIPIGCPLKSVAQRRLDSVLQRRLGQEDRSQRPHPPVVPTPRRQRRQRRQNRPRRPMI